MEDSEKRYARGVNPLVYELFVLGELAVQTLHGYLLREIASHILGPLSPLSWGILYSADQSIGAGRLNHLCT
jgi:hypothetical protein